MDIRLLAIASSQMFVNYCRQRVRRVRHLSSYLYLFYNKPYSTAMGNNSGTGRTRLYKTGKYNTSGYCKN